MKVLHTSDWHIGQELSNWSRDLEHEAFFDQLEQIVVERDVDALLIAGDVFDHLNPSAMAQRVFYDALVRLRRAKPDLSTVVVAGNHDAAGRIEAPRALLAAFGVHVVGSMQRRDGKICAETHLVPLKNRQGEVSACVAALPHLRPSDLPVVKDADGLRIIDSVRSLYEEAALAASGYIGGEPLIMTGHLHVAGGFESEGAERRILVGGQHAVPPDIFPSSAAYVALGHLHRPQHIGRSTVRYSGSPFPMSATERNYEHGVTLVDLAGGEAHPEHIALKRRIPFIRVPQDGAVEFDLVGDVLRDAVEKLGIASDAPASERPFVQLVIKGSGTRSDMDRIVGALPVRVFSIRNERDLVTPIPETQSPEYLADLDPEFVFSDAFLRTHGTKPEPGHLAIFHQALSENQ